MPLRNIRSRGALLTSLVAACLVAASISIASTAPVAAAPDASVSPRIGSPGTSVSVTGGGFDPNVSVDVFFDLTDLARAVSDESGAVSITVTIPSSAQPGTHWITLEERRNQSAAQQSFSLVGSWPQGGWGPTWRGWNPLENTISPSNVDGLTVAWSRKEVSSYRDNNPFVVSDNNVYVFDAGGTLRAYSSKGATLWTSVAYPASGSQATPAVSGTRILIGTAAGTVAAYNVLCRTDGGECNAPIWTRGIGTVVSAGLTVRNGLVYVPGKDGKVHVLSAITGAPRPSITTSFPHSGAVTQPVSFMADGTMLVVQGATLSLVNPAGAAVGDQDWGSGKVSHVAVGNGDAYLAIFGGPYGGLLFDIHRKLQTGITGFCGGVAPVFARGVVYAGSCRAVGAFDAGTLDHRWSDAVSQDVTGIAIANGVLYVCVGGRQAAYNARNGDQLQTGGAPCNSAPEVAGGTVYTSTDLLSAATLDGAINTVAVPRPDPRLLRP